MAKEKDEFVHFDFKEAAIHAICKKVIVDLSIIFAKEKIRCQLVDNGIAVWVRFEDKSFHIYCETLKPYFYCPAKPQKVLLADVHGNMKNKEFIDLLRETTSRSY